MGVQVKTMGMSDRDSEEVDRELSMRLSLFENARDGASSTSRPWSRRDVESGGRNVLATIVRAYYREGK